MYQIQDREMSVLNVIDIYALICILVMKKTLLRSIQLGFLFHERCFQDPSDTYKGHLYLSHTLDIRDYSMSMPCSNKEMNIIQSISPFCRSIYLVDQKSMTKIARAKSNGMDSSMTKLKVGLIQNRNNMYPSIIPLSPYLPFHIFPSFNLFSGITVCPTSSIHYRHVFLISLAT